MRRGGGLVRAATLAGTLAGALALAACSSQGESYWQRFGGFVRQAVTGPGEPPPPRPERTRAELNEIPYATIALSIDGGRRIIMVPLADNGGYLDYRDASNRGIRMLGGALVGTEGLGFDLQAVRVGQRDPVAYQRPFDQWPDEVHREYRFRERHGDHYGITLACHFQPVARETIEIVEILFDVVRVNETCTNQRRQVVNTYWVEEDTGFIWKSEQWVGPQLAQFTIEIIRPYGG